MTDKPGEGPLNRISCPGCGESVLDNVPACPKCRTRIYVEHPADITPAKHPQLDRHTKK